MNESAQLSKLSVKSIMPPATARNRPLYINFAQREGGQEYEYRPALVNGVLQWVLRPVYTLAYWIQRLIRRIRAARGFHQGGYWVLNMQGDVPYSVNLTQ